MASSRRAKAVPATATVAALVDQYAAQRRRALTAATLLILAAWRRWLLGGNRGTPEVARETAALAGLSSTGFAAIVTPVMAGRLYDDNAVSGLAASLALVSAQAQGQASSLAQQFERTILERLGGGVPPLTTSPTGLFTSRRDVDPASVYQRPAVTFRYLRSVDTELSEAVERTEDRIGRLLEDDVMLSIRDAFDSIVNHKNSEATAFRRVIRPELSATGSCGLCIAASDRTYRRGDLMPIHGRCNCIVLPIVGDEDPGRAVNSDDLAKLYKAAGQTSGAPLKRVRAAVEENGELGPVLVRYGQHFLTPEEAEERRRSSRKPASDTGAES